jgi:hypothetical protein
MNLTKISFSSIPITDISPLAGAPLFSVDLRHTRVADLTPLRDSPLKYLRLPRTRFLNEESIAMAKELEKTCEVKWSE